MLESYIYILEFISKAKEISGRKKLQKMVYISKKFNLPFIERFNFHFYGPYSDELTVKVEELCNMGLIEEEKSKKNGATQYVYRLTNSGENVLVNHLEQLSEHTPLINNLQNQSSRFLELVATLLYFESMSMLEAIEKVKTLKSKQNYSDEEFSMAYDFIEKLKKNEVAC
ncbi:MAG: hypothetical protein K0S34_709 [Bacillales bacterium]|jgi:uncharacterized protein YwgA|nr:hypothetical protein [Bacillales bacterium]